MIDKAKLSFILKELIITLKESQQNSFFKYNQQGTLSYLAHILNLKKNGAVVADEVGMGKTRIAIFTMLANALSGQSSLVIVPPGLIHQWIKEWYEVIEQLESAGLYQNELKQIDSPIKIQRIDDIFLYEDYPLIGKRPRIIIIPHTLNMYIKTNSRIDYIDLPQLIKSHDPNLKTAHHREKQYFNAYYSEDVVGEYYRNKGKASKYLFENIDIFTNNGYIDEYGELDLVHEKYFHFKNKKDTSRYKEYTSYFQSGRAGHSIYFKSFFKLIGEYSLVVIDEAHKSKSLSGHEKVLGSIIKFAKGNVNNDVFTVGMTATPVELSPEEWFGIINRVGENINNTEIISGFSCALKNIRRSPNHISFQNEIIEKSQKFEDFLNKTVTRRVRLFQDEFKELLSMGFFDLNECFPHHKRSNVVITHKELMKNDPLWLDIAFYYEAINKASRGLSGKGKTRAKLLDKTFSRGNLNLEYIDELVTELEAECETLQEKRVLHWAKKLQGSIEKARGLKSIHPRLVKTLDLIENIILDNNGDFKNEKVLIFTTFNESAKELNELINHRLTLKIIDKGKPIPISEKYIEDLILAYQECPKDKFQGNLREVNDIRVVLESFRRFYENNRKKITEKVDDDIFTDPTFIGDHFFRTNENGLEIIKNFFSNRLVEEYLGDIRFQYPREAEEDRQLEKEKIKESITKEWKQIVTDYLSTEDSIEDIEDDTLDSDNQDLNYEAPETQGENHEEKRLDYYIDRIKIEELYQILRNVLGEDEEINQPTSKISRRIYGNTKMNARKNVQSLFNDEKRFPKVLVAQSRVGREGLNLHKACRNLILFHQEWNPGVIEQQVGRIDRIGSFWEKLLREWHTNGGQGEPPKIKIFSIVFEGTYDEHQSLVLDERSKNLRAQLFGGILSEDNLREVKDEFKEQVKKNAPNFSPKRFFNNF